MNILKAVRNIKLLRYLIKKKTAKKFRKTNLNWTDLLRQVWEKISANFDTLTGLAKWNVIKFTIRRTYPTKEYLPPFAP